MVCGNNAKLQTVLKAEFGRFDNIHLLGFTDRMSLLMDACDVLFTKPGGLSSTEAAVKNPHRAYGSHSRMRNAECGIFPLSRHVLQFSGGEAAGNRCASALQ